MAKKSVDKVVLTGQKVKKWDFTKCGWWVYYEAFFLPNTTLYFGSSSAKLINFLNVHHSWNKNF